MGVLDKIKNALFEVEYVEVDEPPKKEKKIKDKRKEKIEEKVEEKPIAKKIVLPGKKEEKIEELHEEELRDEDFEIRPKHELIKESPRDEFKFMDDEDFKVESEEPEIVHVIDSKEEVKQEVEVKPTSQPQKLSRVDSNQFVRDRYEEKADTHELYSNSKYSDNKSSKLYGVDSSYSIPVHEYGVYEKKEEKVGFKPSPIISPIYGILDKNYKKEDVVSKSEVRITTNYTRTNVSVDDIRNKAYGERSVDYNDNEKEDTNFEVDEDEEENVLVDLSDKSKPEVKELTMGDALEYFQDLGLEYNVDYVDVSKEKSSSHDVKKANQNISEKSDEIKKEITFTKEDNQNKEEATILKNVVDLRNESTDTNSSSDDDNDNLFDLIDSMYQENE